MSRPNAITRRVADAVQAAIADGVELMSQNYPARSAPSAAELRAGSPAGR